ncbi:MAG: hypothetical protein BGO31_12630 [Bacteroidetes bacterium 43-16]|nr:MAG: hypothetical protein BGO31_12630 [Bacteroidetes bacterium 43-16]
MKEEQTNRTKWITVRVSEKEYTAVQKLFEGTTERKFSTYLRKVLLKQPLIKEVRNASLHEVITVLIRMQKDLNGLTNNYNQMVRKLHISDTRSELLAWIKSYETERERLFFQVETIEAYIRKTADLWLR